MNIKFFFLSFFSIFQKLLCISSDNCNYLAANSEFCYSCSEGFYSLEESTFQGVPFPSRDCLPKIQMNLEMEVFVTNKACDSDSACNGSQESPFDNLINTFEFINKKTMMYSNSVVRIFLLGDELFILPNDLFSAGKYYFRKSRISLTLSPVACSAKNIYGCKGDTETIKINFKTNQIFFFVSSIFKIKNIVFVGNDMPLEKNISQYSSCYSEKKTCCIQGITQTIPSNDNESSCDFDSDQSNVNVNNDNFYGLFNIEYSQLEDNFSFPQILIEDSKFEEISTFFPTNTPRFSSIVQLKDNLINLTLKNVVISNCSFAEGIFIQKSNNYIINNSIVSRPSLNFINVSVIALNVIYYEIRKANPIISILEFNGDVNLVMTSVTNTKNTNITFLDLKNVFFAVNIKDFYFGENENVNFIACQACKNVILHDLTLMRSNSSRTNSLLDIKASEQLSLMNTIIIEYSVFAKDEETLYSLVISRINKNVEIFNIFFERIFCLSIFVDSVILSWQNFFIIDSTSDFIIMKVKNSSVILKGLLFTYLESRFEFLFSIESDAKGAYFFVQVLDSQFFNVLFSKEAVDNGFFEWPIYTNTDEVFINNIISYNCSHTILDSAVSFFIVYGFNKIELKNIEFSFNAYGQNSLLFVEEAMKIDLHNVSFTKNGRADYWLVTVDCSECTTFISNITVDTIIVTIGLFYIKSVLTLMENVTLTNVVGFLSSPIYDFPYVFHQGINIFYKNEFCFVRNWIFRSALKYVFIPSRLFFIRLNKYVIFQGINLQNYDPHTNAPELHVLTVSIDGKLTLIVRDLIIKNFMCQKSIPGYILYEGGLISLFNSRSIIRDSIIYPAEVTLNNISIEQCQFCRNGVIGAFNVESMFMENVYITRTENLKGGCLAFYYGQKIYIKNLVTINNSASQYGGAIFSLGSNIMFLQTVVFTNCSAQLGADIFLKGINNFTISNMSSIQSRSMLDGGLMYAFDANVTFVRGSAFDYQALRDGGLVYIKKGNLRMIDGFNGTGGFAQNGGFIFAFETNGTYLKDIAVSNISGLGKGISLYFEDFSFINSENITLSDIKSGTGFGNLYLLAKYRPSWVEIKNIVCMRISLSEILVYVENELSLINKFFLSFSDILITNSIGSVAFFKSTYLFKNHVFSLRNISVSYFNTNVSLSNEKNYIPEYEFLLDSVSMKIEFLTFKNYSFKSKFLAIYNSDFNFDSFNIKQEIKIESSTNLKVLFLIYLYNTTAIFTRLTYIGDKIRNSALLFSEKSSVNMETGILFGCLPYSGSCLYLFKSSSQITGYSFTQNKVNSLGVLSLRDSRVIVQNTTFRGNSALNNFETAAIANIIVNNLALIGKLDGEPEPSMIINCYFFENNNGTSIFVNNSAVSINYCVFLADKLLASVSTHMKALWGLSSDVDIVRTNFSNFFSNKGGTIRVEHQTDKTVRLFSMQYSTIANSSSEYGGGISLTGLLKIFVSECLFVGNRAFKTRLGEYGNFGVGVFICEHENNGGNNDIILLNNQFINNYAEKSIATVFSNLKIITSISSDIDSNQYFNNAEGLNFSGNLTYLPFKFNFFETLSEASNSSFKSEINHSKTLEFISGQTIPIGFILKDALDQEFILDHNSVASLTNSFKQGSFSLFWIANQKSVSTKAEFNFDKLLINTELNRSFELQLNINLNIQSLYPEDKSLITIDPLTLKFFSKPCETGHIIIEGDLSCVKCPPGKFSLLDPMKLYYVNNFYLRCSACPVNAICLGGSSIIPQPGYWRYSNKSSLIIECLAKSNCLGYDNGTLSDEQMIHGKCLPNTFGPLCYNCDKGFGRFSRKGPCRFCKTEIDAYVKLGIITIFLIIYASVQIKLIFQIDKSSIKGILLKNIVTHFQQLSLITLVNFGWTPDFEIFFSFQEAFSVLIDDLFPLECILPHLGYNVYTQKVIASTLYPLIISIFLILLWILFLIIKTLCDSGTSLKVFQVIQAIFLIIIVLLFPDVMTKCLSLFSCLKVDDSSSIELLLYSPDVVCWSEEHKNYIMFAAIPGLILWGFISPAIIAYFLFQNKNKIKALIDYGSKKNQMQIAQELDSAVLSNKRKVQSAIVLKFLYKGYRSEFYYWELFIFFKKFLLISIGAVSDFFPEKLRTIFLLIPLSFFLIIQIRCQPFESSVLNKLEYFSLITTFITADIGVLMFTKDFSKMVLPSLILVVTLNIVFILVWTYLFGKDFYSSFQRRWKRTSTYFIEPLPLQTLNE